MNLLNVGGFVPETGRYFNYIETYGGGQGAMHDRDGMNGVHSHMTNTRNAPVEAIDGIQTAVVHLALPQKQVFADNQDPATASVLVSTKPGATLDEIKRVGED